MTARRVLARIEKLVAARVVVERKLDDQIAGAITRARAQGASWWRIGRAVIAGGRRGARR